MNDSVKVFCVRYGELSYLHGCDVYLQDFVWGGCVISMDERHVKGLREVGRILTIESNEWS